MLQRDAELEHRRLQGIIRQWEEFVDVLTGERDWLDKLVSRRQQAAAVTASDTAMLHELRRISAEYEDMQQSLDSKKSLMIQVCTRRACWVLEAFEESFAILSFSVLIIILL